MSFSDGASKSSSKSSTKPTYSRFTQQELPACKPILTPALVMTTFIMIGITFIPIGLSHLSASENVPKKMKQPIFVYYQLDQFYQNHRRYVKSQNDEQYRDPSASAKTTNCEPEAQLSEGQPIVPCGLIAWSLFNDTYTLSRNDVALPINKKGIAWESDRTHKFGSNVYAKNFQNRSLIGGGKLIDNIPLNQQEDLLVWMRTAALPNFRKLYGRIETDLEVNEIIKVVIQNNYNTYSFNGKKKLVISTTTWIGGKNDFLGMVYIIVGGVCLLIALVFITVYLIKPRPLGDPSYLSWNKNPASVQ
ncbi:ALA-interacting subunit 3-like isoform X3 [Salvia splendens]|uniref:ALA-interacting subunit 3-like isoform X3 n=1 Tax=Salvia splendens TaxID=180675 RepID=UPI001C256216|nr:ALA-interacting subunit 3-like isoform X3 [Salvia splendens]